MHTRPRSVNGLFLGDRLRAPGEGLRVDPITARCSHHERDTKTNADVALL